VTWILLLFQSFYTNRVISTYCSGDNACYGQTGTNTINDGSCNGFGVCEYMTSSIVYNGSCNSTSAGYYGGYGGDYQCSSMTHTTVESGSCNGGGGGSVCSDMAYSKVGTGSCNGDGAYNCYYMFNTTVGKNSCTYTKVPEYPECSSSSQCDSMKNSKVGDGSCLSDYACQNVVNSTIGKGSCKSSSACWFCSNSTVPDGQCTSSSGWYDQSGGHYNSCIWCSNCVTQSTGVSCRTSQVPGTVTAPTVRRLNDGGTTDQGFNDGTCPALLETILSFFKNHDHADNFLKKKFLGKFTEASLDGTNPGDCKIRFKFHFEHLGEKKRLTKACDALLAAFEQQKDDFFAIHTHFAKIMFACEAIDLNTVTTYKPKKSKNSKQKKRVHSSTTPKKKNPP